MESYFPTISFIYDGIVQFKCEIRISKTKYFKTTAVLILVAPQPTLSLNSSIINRP